MISFENFVLNAQPKPKGKLSFNGEILTFNTEPVALVSKVIRRHPYLVLTYNGAILTLNGNAVTYNKTLSNTLPI